MKKDAEVAILRRERHKGVSQAVAAARAGMSVRTARTYEQSGQLPSQRTQPRTYRTRPNPFADDWSWITQQLERDAALQATTLFALLVQRHPDHYQPVQLRALQRHIATWRCQHGPEREVFFAQDHPPGQLAQSDFTVMDALQVTLAGMPFPHRCFHMVLTYSNVEAITICFSESFESLAEGIETCLWQFGGVPYRHRTDNLTAAVRPLSADGRKDFTTRYHALMQHYGMQPTTNTPGTPNQNGDVEQAHYRFKQAVDQALRVRGSRDFADRANYTRFLDELVRQRNLTRQTAWVSERAALQPLPTTPLAPCRDVRVTVGRGSTMQVLKNTYSVPSRFIGASVLVRIHAETLDVYHGTVRVLSLPRLLGQHQHRIDYRHLAWSLLRKPGAFAQYRYRNDLFPSLIFRQVYDQLQQAQPRRADEEYVRVLHLAASTSEADVEAALVLLREQRVLPTFAAVRELVRTPTAPTFPNVCPPIVDLQIYDQLLAARGGHA